MPSVAALSRSPEGTTYDTLYTFGAVFTAKVDVTSCPFTEIAVALRAVLVPDVSLSSVMSMVSVDPIFRLLVFSKDTPVTFGTCASIAYPIVGLVVGTYGLPIAFPAMSASCTLTGIAAFAA
jgi:hypothetical protein